MTERRLRAVPEAGSQQHDRPQGPGVIIAAVYELPFPARSEHDLERFRHAYLDGLSGLELWAEHQRASVALAFLLGSVDVVVILGPEGPVAAVAWNPGAAKADRPGVRTVMVDMDPVSADLLTAELAERLAECLDRALGAIGDLAGVCAEAVLADQQYRAALSRDRRPVDRPPAAELLVEVSSGAAWTACAHTCPSSARRRQSGPLSASGSSLSPPRSKGVGNGLSPAHPIRAPQQRVAGRRDTRRDAGYAPGRLSHSRAAHLRRPRQAPGRRTRSVPCRRPPGATVTAFSAR